MFINMHVHLPCTFLFPFVRPWKSNAMATESPERASKRLKLLNEETEKINETLKSIETKGGGASGVTSASKAGLPDGTR